MSEDKQPIDRINELLDEARKAEGNAVISAVKYAAVPLFARFLDTPNDENLTLLTEYLKRYQDTHSKVGGQDAQKGEA